MSLTSISGTIQSQPLNDNFSYLNQRKNEIGYNVKDDTYGAVGNGTTGDYGALLAAANAATVSGGDVLFPPGTYRITANITFTSNITLKFSDGAKLSIDSGVIVTINGNILAGIHQIFSGSGTVSGSPKVNKVYVQWWGAKNDGITNDYSSIQAAITFVGSQMGKGDVVVPKGNYVLGTGLDFSSFSSAAGKPCGFIMEKGSKLIATVAMSYMINITGNDSGQFQNTKFVFDHLDGQTFATYIIRIRNISDSYIECGVIQNGTSGFVSDMSGNPAYGNFNNKIFIRKIVDATNYGFYCIGNQGANFTDFQGNYVNIRQIVSCGADGIRLNDNTTNRTWYNVFDIGASEENGAYGIYLNSGRNQWRVCSTNTNITKGLGGANGLDKNLIEGYFEDGIDTNQITGHDVRTNFPIVKNGGITSVLNGGTISHGLVDTPTKVKLTARESGHIATAFTASSTTITVGLYNHDGTAITSSETVWWEAEV